VAATTTIRLPPKLRARIGNLAKQTGRSAHSLIVEAVERHTNYEEQMRSLVKEAFAADSEIDKTGEVYRADDVHAWMKRLAADESATRPKPWRRWSIRRVPLYILSAPFSSYATRTLGNAALERD
jgi:predicted transcriptional regulator